MDRFEEAKAKIKDAIDLVTLVESYLPLKRAGRNMVGLCPFHAEKSPSFNVSPATQHYKCFGCGKAGDVFSFVMEREGLDFRAAFELLAERAGVPLEGVFQGGRSDGRSQRTLVAQTLSTVSSYFQACLQSGAGDAARAYIERRGLLPAVESFGLGFHPVGGELLNFARSRKLPLEVLQAVGLLGRDGRREMFAGRVMFPITDEGGRIVGFGGRVLTKEQEPKYLNSPESPFFNKRRLLFGLRQVKDRGVRKLVVVEGYTDVIACHLAGVHGAVATLGTSLTADHARLLLRYATEGVVLLFDGDRAGRQAAERALRELCNVELPVRIAFMDDGIDPADLLQVAPTATAEMAEAGRARMEAILAAAEDPMVAWFKLLRGRYDFRDEVGMSKAAQECGALLSAVESPVRRETMLRRMAPWFGGDESGLRRLLKPVGGEAAAPAQGQKPEAPAERHPSGPRPKRPFVKRGPNDPPPPIEPLRDRDVARMLGGPSASGPSGDTEVVGAERGLVQAEVDLLACVLALPALRDRLAGESLTDPRACAVWEAFAAVSQDAAVSMERLAQGAFSNLATAPAAASLLAEVVERARHIREPETAFAAVEGRRRQFLARQQARRLRRDLEEARLTGDQVKVDALTRLFYQQLRQP